MPVAKPPDIAAAARPSARTEGIERRTAQLNLFHTAPVVVPLASTSAYVEAVRHRADGDRAAEAAALRRCIDRLERPLDARVRLAILTWEDGDAAGAVDLLLEAVASDDRGVAHYNLGLLLADLGEYHAAYVHLRLAERAGLTGPQLASAIEETARGTGRTDEADRSRLATAAWSGRPDGEPPASFLLPSPRP